MRVLNKTLKKYNQMKLLAVLSTIILSVITIGCTKYATEYNGYIKNSSDSLITFEIIGDTLLVDSLAIAPGLQEKIYHFREEGDFEIYDCKSFFDSIYYKKGENWFSIPSDSAVITTTSNLESNNTRVHSCIIHIE